MNDIVVACWLSEDPVSNKWQSVLQVCGMVPRQVKVLDCKLMYNGIQFNNRSVDTMLDECFCARADPESTVPMSDAVIKATGKIPYMNKAELSLSTRSFSPSTSRAASIIVNME